MDISVGSKVKVTDLKPGYLVGVKGEVITRRTDDRCNVLLSVGTSDKVRQAITSRGKPHQLALYPTDDQGRITLLAVPLASLAVAS